MNHSKKPRRPAPFLMVVTALATVLGACGRDAPEAKKEPGTARAATAAAGGVVFTEEAESTGLDFVHWNGMTGELHLAEITCSGGALFDADGDGDLDVYLLQFSPPAPQGAPQGRGAAPAVNRLYRNEHAESGRLSFTDVTATMGVQAPGYGCAVATGDYDNDGATDVYVLNLGPNQLLRNRGDGTFEDVTERAGVGEAGPGSTATFVDLDRDGWLDLFVGNYSDYFPENEPGCLSLSGAPDYCGPGAYPARRDRLYRNRGAGTGGRVTFEDVTEISGLGSAPPRPALGVVAGDFNGDGLPDLYVANDGEVNHLWLNQGPGPGPWVSFHDDAMLAGCALNAHGEAEASMGVDAGDVDNDGDPDLILTHLAKETNTLYKNDGRGLFTDATAASGLGAPSFHFTSFGTGFLDYDNDGWLDLFVASGAVVLIPELVAAGDPFPLHQPNQLFRNLGGGRFAETTAEAGPVFELSEVSRAAAFGDVDDDGDTDVLVMNVAAPARLLVNRVGHERPWLGLRLVTGNPPRDALGATVALLRGGKPVTWRRVGTDGSYAAASDPRVLFGLGEDPRVDGVGVVWPDGRKETFSGLEVGRYQTLRQGEGSR